MGEMDFSVNYYYLFPNILCLDSVDNVKCFQCFQGVFKGRANLRQRIHRSRPRTVSLCLHSWL